MKEKIIKDIQKFINTPFRYSDLLTFINKQKDFLLQKNILEKTEDAEYNALWDTMIELEDYFIFANNNNNLVVLSEINITSLFNNNFKLRDKTKK